MSQPRSGRRAAAANPARHGVALFATVYVGMVLLVDYLAAQRVGWPFSWAVFRWMLDDLSPALRGTLVGRFDLFKFVFWLLIPLAVCWKTMDWRYLLRGAWTRRDAWFVGGLALAGMAAMFLIPLVPALREFYPSLRDWPVEQRIDFFLSRLVWIASWLIGWEFLHRYLLLHHVQRMPVDWSRLYQPQQWAWLVVPLMETAYHLQKAWLEAVGMFFFSTVLTLWCLQRRNWLIPFLVHLIIEVELLLFMTLAP